MPTAQFTGTVAGQYANGCISWPDTYPAVNQTAEFAKVALQGLLSHDAHLLLSEAEVCDKAWRLAKEMKLAAQRCGEWV